MGNGKDNAGKRSFPGDVNLAYITTSNLVGCIRVVYPAVFVLVNSSTTPSTSQNYDVVFYSAQFTSISSPCQDAGANFSFPILWIFRWIEAHNFFFKSL